MKTSVPIVEIADDADALRVRRPDGEARAGNAVNRAQLRAELVVDFPLVPLAEEKQIRLAERRQEGIRIARAAGFSLMIGDDEIVGVDGIRQFSFAFKNIRV